MYSITNLRRAMLALLAALSISAAALAGGPPPKLHVTIDPHNENGTVRYVYVHESIGAPDVKAGATFLHMPEVFAGVESVVPEDIQLKDASGTLPVKLLPTKQDASGFISYRRWAVTRASKGDVTLDYRIKARVFIPKLGSGPPFDLRPEEGGINGCGDTFLLLPSAMTPYRITMDWNLSHLPGGAMGVSSFGEGTIHTVGPALVLAHAYYDAGKLYRYPTKGKSRFTAYWQTKPYLDLGKVAAYTEKAFHVIADFYGDKTTPYAVFFRKNPYPGRGGAMLHHSFMLGYGDSPRQTIKTLRVILAHETVHTWPLPIDGPNGETAWYAEGMAEYYSATLLLRHGLMSSDDFLEEINKRAQRYYTNAVNTIPAKEIGAQFWKDGRVRQIPYDRGSFYMATMNAEIRDATHGKHSLDDVSLEMMKYLKSGQDYNARTWVKLLHGYLGDKADRQYKDMMAGKIIEPPADTFGKCFIRKSVTYRQFDLGFDMVSLAKLPRVIRGLKPGSAAAKAGLRNGDVIAKALPIEEAEAKDGNPLIVPVIRNGKTVNITYVPRGKKVAGFRWDRAPGSPETGCTY